MDLWNSLEGLIRSIWDVLMFHLLVFAARLLLVILGQCSSCWMWQCNAQTSDNQIRSHSASTMTNTQNADFCLLSLTQFSICTCKWNLLHCLDVLNESDTIIWMLELSFLRTFAPGNESSIGWNFRSGERKFHGTFVPWNFRSLELSLPGTKVPWNFRSLELLLPGTFVPFLLIGL